MGWEPRVGMRVVCVDARPTIDNGFKRSYLVKGQVYTIRSAGTDARINKRLFADRNIDVWLNEVVRPEDLGLSAARFMPLRERKTDISIFTALLTKAPTPEKEPA